MSIKFQKELETVNIKLVFFVRIIFLKNKKNKISSVDPQISRTRKTVTEAKLVEHKSLRLLGRLLDKRALE